MTIDKLIVFAETGDKNTDELNLSQGFPSKLQPARQWHNWLFNIITSKINELIDRKLGVGDNAVSATKLETARKINNVGFDGTKDINLILSNGFAETGLGAKSKALPAGDLGDYTYFTGWYTLAGVYSNAPVETSLTGQMLVSVRTYGAGPAIVFQLWNGSAADYYIGTCTYTENPNNTVTPNGAISWEKVAYEKSNVASATKLANARNINGVGFDGTADINLPLLGYAQTWQDVTASRVSGVTYTNPTGKPIMVSVSLADTNDASPTVTIKVGGVIILTSNYDASGGYGTFSHSFIVPGGATYQLTVSAGASIISWAELKT